MPTVTTRPALATMSTAVRSESVTPVASIASDGPAGRLAISRLAFVPPNAEVPLVIFRSSARARAGFGPARVQRAGRGVGGRRRRKMVTFGRPT
jgi:hypothetical protein